MDTFDNFKNQIAEAQEFFASFIQNASFPSEKKESRLFTAQEATVIMNEFINLLTDATKNRDRFIRRIGVQEIRTILSAIDDIKTEGKNGNFNNFISHVENLIPSIRTVEMLFMDIADKNRYQQIVDLEQTIVGINRQKTEINRIYKNASSKVAEINKLHETMSDEIEGIKKQEVESQKLFDDFNNHQTAAQKHEEAIKNMLDKSNEYLPKIKEANELAQELKEAIDSMETVAKEHDKILNDLITRHKEVITNHQHEITLSNQAMQASTQEAQELIKKAQDALRISSGAGLSEIFTEKQDRAADQDAKAGWIALLLLASICAIGLGVITIITTDEISTEFVIIRALLLFIAMAVAGFAAKQYAKNKTIEEDYAYKSALAGSFPGLIKELDQADKEKSGYSKKYVQKFLSELLQDPQRDRNQDSTKDTELFDPSQDKTSQPKSDD